MKRIGRYVMAGLSLMVAACNSDTELTDVNYAPQQEVVLLPCFSSFYEANQMPTRSLPDGYKEYSELSPATALGFTSIYVIMTTASDEQKNYDIRYRDSEWSASMDITDGQTYYVYGFMPNELATDLSIEKNGASFADGATMTVDNLNVLTPADVCVVVGAKKTDATTNIKDADIRLGQFDYMGSSKGNNYLCLLLKHLYAGLLFTMHVDSEYDKLRTIKVKKMVLRSTDEIAAKVKLTIPLTANTTGTDPMGAVGMDEQGTATIASTTMFEGEEQIKVDTKQNFFACFAPGKCASFDLVTTYDVYDTKGNLIRKDCTATNQISKKTLGATFDIETLQAGQLFTIDLNIKPTYLYVLSDPDLDNPTFDITAAP